jgi:hypothetical protein
MAGVYIGESEPRGVPTSVVPYDEHEGRQPVANGTSLACKSIADTFLNESQIGDRKVTSRAARGTYDVALKISEDGRSLSLLTAADVSGVAGASDHRRENPELRRGGAV